MSKTLSIVLIACLALLVSACAAGPQSLIIGKWEVENAPMKMTAEFKGDGTASVTILGHTLPATYHLTEDELTWTVNGITSSAKVHVTLTELELTDSMNRTIKYKRR